MLLLSCAFVFVLFCFVLFLLLLNSMLVLKGNDHEKQQSHLEIETRRNYFPDHLFMQIKTQIRPTSRY